MKTLGSNDEAALGLQDAAAVAIFEVISKALVGFFNTLVANKLPTLAEILPNFFEKATWSLCLYRVITNSHQLFCITNGLKTN